VSRYGNPHFEETQFGRRRNQRQYFDLSSKIEKLGLATLEKKVEIEFIGENAGGSGVRLPALP
jgi:hypothetical protein